MELVFGWMPFALLGAVLVGFAIYLIVSRGRRRRGDTTVLPAAHVERLFALPEYRRAYRRGRVLFSALLAVTLFALGGLAIVAGRPVTTSVVKTETANRDIVLCLDVSGSMLGDDAEVLEQFRTIAKGFNGERISLVIWNASAVQVFPLTDDYSYVDEQLETVADAAAEADRTGQYPDTNQGYFDLLSGTLLGSGSSLIGDGLASCVLRFDNEDKQRSRTVLLATDNELYGEPLVSLDEASKFAQERKVRVYALTPSFLGISTPEKQELEQEAEATGGKLFGLDDATAADEIVKRVLADQASKLEGTPRLVINDEPGVALVLGILAVWLIAFIGWRMRT
ncbi:VWA domain-containing protein [Schumannella sp. 10F1B-5-1]|uniref:vWA domain-containing protein n=1 Tax=Schumannella sp. 10F1B-5-1 TaxID=2590780 RepID=UPI0011321E4A|nr:VWA domain-containing protein [Schumannella sp. 10F1B-5-1]TPW70719.1 VWA domain-containing protein [Schumannella sp. 10F1B-5-1]